MMFNMACDVKKKEFCSFDRSIKTQGVITLYSLHNYTTSNYVIDNMWNVDGRETCKNFEFLFCAHNSFFLKASYLTFCGSYTYCSLQFWARYFLFYQFPIKAVGEHLYLYDSFMAQ